MLRMCGFSLSILSQQHFLSAIFVFGYAKPETTPKLLRSEQLYHKQRKLTDIRQVLNQLC
jgi:hypothetical protein